MQQQPKIDERRGWCAQAWDQLSLMADRVVPTLQFAVTKIRNHTWNGVDIN